MGWTLASRWMAFPDTQVDAWWLCCALLRCTSAGGDAALADAVREARAITEVLGMAETPLGEALRREDVSAEALDQVAAQQGPRGRGLPATALWPSFRPLLALSLAWDGVIEGHPVLRGVGRRLPERSAGRVEELAAEVVAMAQASAATAREMAPVLVAAWGGEPGRVSTFAELLAVEPGLAEGCWFV